MSDRNKYNYQARPGEHKPPRNADDVTKSGSGSRSCLGCLGFLVVVGLIVWGVVSLIHGVSSSASNSDQHVIYVSADSGQASVTWEVDGNGGQDTEAATPWHKVVRGSTLGVTAQNSGGGSITCKVFDSSGNLVSHQTSTGEYAIVSCTG